MIQTLISSKIWKEKSPNILEKTLSIIIPTSNRRDTLEKTLKTLFGVGCSREYEVIVVDRPMDDTREMLEPLFGKHPIRYFEQSGQGRPGARNIGIREARGEILLFLDDDILVQEDFIEEHMRHHREFPEDACLGQTVNKTDSKDLFVKYIVDHSTFLTAYSLIHDPDDVAFNFFYTSNISLRRKGISELGLFDESFFRYGLEDIEFGYRWKKAGHKIRYNPKAVGCHYYNTIKEDFFNRRREVGQAAAIFYQKHKNDPQVREYLHIDVASRLTSGSDLIAQKAGEIIATIEGLTLSDGMFGSQGIREALHSCYSLLIAYHYYQGLREGLLKVESRE